jgi:hypothetical protein
MAKSSTNSIGARDALQQPAQTAVGARLGQVAEELGRGPVQHAVAAAPMLSAALGVLPHFRCKVKLRLQHPKVALGLSEARNLPAHTSAA